MIPKYCLDSSLLINGWVKHYRPDVFPEVWELIGTGISCGKCMVPWEVWKEILRKDDSLCRFLKQHRSMINPPSQKQLELMPLLMEAFPNFAAIGGSSNAADPWVIVAAQEFDAVVVTDEQDSPCRDTKPPKIPFVCRHLNVNWMTPIDFIADLRSGK